MKKMIVFLFHFAFIGLSKESPARPSDLFRKDREQHMHAVQKQQTKQEQKIREEMMKKPFSTLGGHLSEELENISWPEINIYTRNRSFRKQLSIFPQSKLKANFTDMDAVKFLVQEALKRWVTITFSDVNNTVIKSGGGFRVQRIDGEWWLSDEREFRFESRNEAMKLMLFTFDQFYSERIPNGLDFWLSTSDAHSTHFSGLVMAFCSHQGNAIAIPDFTFIGWPEVKQPSFTALYRSLLEKSRAEKNKDGQIFFTGALFDTRLFLLGAIDANYVHVAEHTFGRHEGAKDLVVEKHFKTIEEICQNRYLLHLPGANSYSSRLKYLLLCNSTVFIIERWRHVSDAIAWNYAEWYYPMLEPWVHFIPAGNGGELKTIHQFLSTAPNEAQDIASASFALAKRIFNPNFVQEYFVELLTAYASRMTYNATQPLPGAIPLMDGILSKLAY